MRTRVWHATLEGGRADPGRRLRRRAEQALQCDVQTQSGGEHLVASNCCGQLSEAGGTRAAELVRLWMGPGDNKVPEDKTAQKQDSKSEGLSQDTWAAELVRLKMV